MRRVAARLTLIVLMGACLALAGCESMTREKWFDTVRPGMTRGEVIQALGRPPDKSTSSHGPNFPHDPNRYEKSTWKYGHSSGIVYFSSYSDNATAEIVSWRG